MGISEWAERNKPGGSDQLAKKAQRDQTRDRLREHHVAAKAARVSNKVETFEGIHLSATTITHRGQGGTLAGATARVDTGTDVRRRVTAGRVLAVGVLALAAKKQTGHIYLIVENRDYEFMVEIHVKNEAGARKFAAKINDAAKRAV